MLTHPLLQVEAELWSPALSNPGMRAVELVVVLLLLQSRCQQP
jgi:hypothetical protein